jgi:hypothetical protein
VALYPGLRRPGHEADHSPPSSAEVKDAWRYTSISSIFLHGVVLSLKKAQGQIYFTFLLKLQHVSSLNCASCILHSRLIRLNAIYICQSFHGFVHCTRTWKEVTGGWGKLHNGELHNLYYSPNIIRVTKLRKMRWARHVARM